MSTLKNLVDETTLIKNDIVSCRNSLENNLKSKGIEVVEGSKMSTLIDKVGGISTTKCVAGDRFNAYSKTTSTQIGYTEGEKIYCTYKCENDFVSIRVKLDI